ncbi:N-acetylmuramoyl-L-alanine amidase [Antrihabitans stalactiti]|uniref:Cold-shock protein n=1 Tax=Antrihabitans stalactiti TaxID=2584121 RepID=A0A848KQS4_9NOCA|nr:N-acetylmuramoyl-L-alanine amidase [Antrihabitans stalactiti]NMN98620.1 cold-shock protein [Antrihabitans stalactiti]
MPYRRPKPSIVLGAVAAIAVASPIAAYTVGPTTDVTHANDKRSAVPTQIAELVVASLPDIVIPLKDITGLDLPDLRLSDLKNLPLPNEIVIPSALPIPEIPGLIDPATPVTPDQLPPGVVDRVGTTVKEVTHDTPFSMIALTAKNLASADAKVRVKKEDGTWGPWWSTEQLDTRRTDSTAPGTKTGTEPIYVGETKTAQVLVTRKTEKPPVAPAAPATPTPTTPTPAPPAPANPEPATTAPQAPAAPAPATPPTTEATPPAPTPAAEPVPAEPLGYMPASVNKPLREEPAPGDDVTDDMSVALIDPGSAPDDANLSDIAEPLPHGGPKVITREQWGADESIRCQNPDYDDFIGGATVHHTAGNNDYTKAESAEIVRAIYAYHAQTLDWCDIGYNALVDKYGQIFEGRAGGLDKAVQGAHAGGFNENTVGVAMMGNYDEVEPTAATLNAIGSFIGWRLKSANLDPKGTTVMYSEGTEFTPFAEGEEVDLPVIFAHRDVGNTDCPGELAYEKMDEIRDIAETFIDASNDVSEPAPVVPRRPTPSTEVEVAPESPVTVAPPAPVETRPSPLPTELVRATDTHPIAQRWVAEGGEQGRLGAALSGLLPAKDGQQYAKFANGFIYSAPGGKIVTVVGRILEQFLQLGLDASALGLPLTDEIPVPEGVRVDFQHGSLIFNQVTGFVSTLVKTYNDSYEENYNNPPN